MNHPYFDPVRQASSGNNTGSLEIQKDNQNNSSPADAGAVMAEAAEI